MSNNDSAEHRPRFFNITIEGNDTGLSPELRGIVADFVREMTEEYESRKKGCYDLLRRYPDDEGLKQLWTPEKIEEFASGADNYNAIETLRRKRFDEITWHDLMSAQEQNPEAALACMNVVYDSAGDHIKGGLYASQAIGFKLPFEKARFSFIRNAFIKEWQPRGGIEAALVDMLAQSYVAWQYWLERSFSIANNEDSIIEQKKRNARDPYEQGGWLAPRLTAAEYLERATQMADRFNRMFLRILRQMRDLRRYSSPVVINNPQQVNVAAEGGQQVNVQETKKNKRKQNGAAKSATHKDKLLK